MRQDFELSNIFTVSLLSSHQNSSFWRVSCELSNKQAFSLLSLKARVTLEIALISVDFSICANLVKVSRKSMLLLVPLNVGTARREDSPLGMLLPHRRSGTSDDRFCRMWCQQNSAS